MTGRRRVSTEGSALCNCSGRMLLQDIPIDLDDLKRTAVRVLAKGEEACVVTRSLFVVLATAFGTEASALKPCILCLLAVCARDNLAKGLSPQCPVQQRGRSHWPIRS